MLRTTFRNLCDTDTMHVVTFFGTTWSEIEKQNLHNKDAIKEFQL